MSKKVLFLAVMLFVAVGILCAGMADALSPAGQESLNAHATDPSVTLNAPAAGAVRSTTVSSILIIPAVIAFSVIFGLRALFRSHG